MAKPRGFAAMDPKKREELARRGGHAAQERGTAHRFTREEAREAGAKGGRALQAKVRAARNAVRDTIPAPKPCVEE